MPRSTTPLLFPRDRPFRAPVAAFRLDARRRLPEHIPHFGAQSHGLSARCVRFTSEVTLRCATLAFGWWPPLPSRLRTCRSLCERFPLSLYCIPSFPLSEAFLAHASRRLQVARCGCNDLAATGAPLPGVHVVARRQVAAWALAGQWLALRSRTREEPRVATNVVGSRFQVADVLPSPTVAVRAAILAPIWTLVPAIREAQRRWAALRGSRQEFCSPL